MVSVLTPSHPPPDRIQAEPPRPLCPQRSLEHESQRKILESSSLGMGFVVTAGHRLGRVCDPRFCYWRPWGGTGDPGMVKVPVVTGPPQGW